jgi:hypothetical protein
MTRPTDAQLIAMLDKAAWVMDDLFSGRTDWEDFTEHERQHYETLVAEYRAAANALRSEILPPQMVERAGAILERRCIRAMWGDDADQRNRDHFNTIAENALRAALTAR